MSLIKIRILLFTFYCLLLTAFWGCASLSQKENILAVVNGEPVSEDDLKYSLEIAHRREDLSSAGTLNLSQFIQKLIDDRLIIQEARNIGMDEYPEVQQAIQAYILRESVVRLHDEEIIKKVQITEDEIKDYYKEIYKKEAPDKELERFRGNIEKAIRKKKEKERSDEYLKHLYEQATIKIDKELLSAINLQGGKEEKEKLSKDTRVVAEVNGSTLTVGDFISIATPNTTISKEEILDNWIDLKLIDHEALSRHYERKPELKNMVNRYKDQLLKNTFIKKVIIPQINISVEQVRDYYLSHQKSFTKPVTVKIQQITVKTIDKAQEILDNLKRGTDFSWLAKKWSVDTAAENNGEIGWLTETDMPKPVREILVTLMPGDISSIIKIDSFYRIIRLKDRKEGEVEEFDKVKNAVYRSCFEDQLNSIYNKYVSQLKKDAEIRINDEVTRSLEKRLQK